MFVIVLEETVGLHLCEWQCIFVTMPDKGKLVYKSSLKTRTDTCWLWLGIGRLRRSKEHQSFHVRYWSTYLDISTQIGPYQMSVYFKYMLFIDKVYLFYTELLYYKYTLSILDVLCKYYPSTS